MVAAFSPRHPLASRKIVPLSDLETFPCALTEPSFGLCQQLERVFAIRVAGTRFFNGNGAIPCSDAPLLQSHSAQSGEVAALRELIEKQDATIAELRASIRDCGDRLDRSEVERRQLSERLTALLTHRRAGSVPDVTERDLTTRIERRWWRRWFR